MKPSSPPLSAPPLSVVFTPGRGRGVVAQRAFAVGELVERAPVIVLTPEELAQIRGTLLARYYFEWGADEESGALALGYGSLYNHSFTPNLEFESREDQLVIDFVALREIAPGDELSINYNNTGEFADVPVQFEAHPHFD